MSIIRQGSLFDLQDLYDLEPTQRYDAVLSCIDMDSILYKVNKKSWLGAPTELNYAAMINSLCIRIFEHIPTIKDLVKRLNDEKAIMKLIHLKFINYSFFVSLAVAVIYFAFLPRNTLHEGLVLKYIEPHEYTASDLIKIRTFLFQKLK